MKTYKVINKRKHCYILMFRVFSRDLNTCSRNIYKTNKIMYYLRVKKKKEIQQNDWVMVITKKKYKKIQETLYLTKQLKRNSGGKPPIITAHTF